MTIDRSRGNLGRPARPAAGVVALATLVACLALLSPRAFGSIYPPGYAESIAVDTIPFPITLDWDPAGGMWVGSQTGQVWVWRGGVLKQAATLAVGTGDELGITGLTVDPGFATNGFVWIYYSTPPPVRQRVSRFVATNDTLGGEVVMVEFPVDNTFHHAGCIRFGPDGTLYVASGDDGEYSVTAQNPFDLRGKILHINPDGTGASDNPYLDGAAGDPRVWVLGLRHPWKFALQPVTGNVFIPDVGEGAWEEIDIGLAGANYGWAAVEGPSPPGQAGFVYPIYWYPHTNPAGNSIIGGAFAEAGDLSPDVAGNFFFGDEAANELHRLVLDATNQPIFEETWATNLLGPVEVRFGPDGALYFASWQSGTVRRVAYIGGANRPPLAVGVATPPAGAAPLTVTLDGTGSSDPDNDPLTYHWDSGNNATGNTATLQHVYPAGVYNAVLTVNDGHGGVSTSPPVRVVSGNRPPVAAITAPADQSTYVAGQTIAFSGSGSDFEDGALGCSAFTWTVLFHHLGHVHPHLGPLEGICGGSFTIPTTGEVSAATFYEIILDVKDSGAPLGSAAVLTTETSIQIRPITVQMTLVASPNPGLTLTLDDQLMTAPIATQGVVNHERTIGAPSPQTGADGRTYTFASWSDGGAATHVISTPPQDTTYTASFACNVLTEVPNLQVAQAAGGQVTLTWSPPADPCLAAAGATRYRIYASFLAHPIVPPGQFPTDPSFHERGTSTTESFTYAASASDRFFLVTAIGTDGQEGPVGHYGD